MGKVSQSDVPAGFRMPVPVEFTLETGHKGRLRVLVDEGEETFTLDLPKKPVEVVFNPEGEVLARVRRER